MAQMPGAVWRPMPGSSTARIGSYDIFCLHTMVGSLDGTDNYFRTSASGTNSHFGVGGDGTIYQWVDTAYRSGANYNGNYHIVSVETADMGAPFGPWGGTDVPAWTAAQIDGLGRIARWVRDTHGIPLTQIPDAKPGRRGVGYHRLGVPGYMLAGAEQWSTAQGKVCPGDRRISQVPQVIARAQGEDMPLTQQDIDAVVTAIYNAAIPRSGTKPDGSPQAGKTNLLSTLAWLDSNFAGLASAIGKSVDPKAVADAIVSQLPASDAQKVATLVLAGLNGAQLSVTQPS